MSELAADPGAEDQAASVPSAPAGTAVADPHVSTDGGDGEPFTRTVVPIGEGAGGPSGPQQAVPVPPAPGGPEATGTTDGAATGAPPVEYSLVSQGGVAKGAWQAGFAYYFAEWRKRAAGQGGTRLHTVAGASAGAVNGLIAALASCQTAFVAPTDSLFYEIWVDRLGLFERGRLPGMFPGESGDEPPPNKLGLFERAPLDRAVQAALDQFGQAGQFIPGCHVDTTFTTTHLTASDHPVYVDAQQRPVMTRSSVRRRFALTVTPHPLDNTPRVHNNVPDHQEAYYAILGHSDYAVEPELLFTLTRASGAFPAAFEPVPLDYTERTIDGQRTEHTAALFVDGGIFNNTPVNLAIEVNKARHERASTDAFTARYLFLEPNVTTWQAGHLPPKKEPTQPRNLVEALAQFALPFASSSSDAEFFDATQRYPFLRSPGKHPVEGDAVATRELGLPLRDMPITGAELGAFFAFLERDLRVYDFYVGMADAHRFLAAKTDWAKPAGLTALDTQLRSIDPRYRRMAEHYAGSAASVPAACDDLSDLDDTVRVSECNYQVLIAAMTEYRAWSRKHLDAAPDQQLLAFTRALAGEPESAIGDAAGCEPQLEVNNRFRFVDLHSAGYDDVPGASDGEVSACGFRHVLRALGDDALDAVTDTTDGTTWHLLRVAHDPVLEAITGVPAWPKWTVGVGVGRGLEGFVGRRVYYGLRADLGLRLFRITQGVQIHDDVELTHLASDLYLRLLQVIPMGGLFSVDPYAGWHLGLADAWSVFHGPALGVRVSLINRLSVGVEARYVWAQHYDRQRWPEGHLYFSYQFFP